MIHGSIVSTQLGSDPPIAVRRHFDCYLLDRISQLHLFSTLLDWLQESIVSPSAHLGDLAKTGYRSRFFADLVVDRSPPLSAACCSSKVRTSFFKKSISIVICPTLRSSSASWLSMSIRLP